MSNNDHSAEPQIVNTPRRASNIVGVRNYNERVILQLIRDHGSITKADATRATGLSANATSVIFRSLEEENLLQKGEPIRGRIGQPSIPISLNPDAAYFFGLKIGRRSSDLVLMNFAGDIVASQSIYHDYPLPNKSVDFAQQAIPELIKKSRVPRKKIVGLGVAMPFELWSWTEDFGAPKDDMLLWQSFDVEKELGKVAKMDVSILNDATAACCAELTLGGLSNSDDILYFYIGTIIGGGVIMNGSVFAGKTGNAGGFGPMPIPSVDGKIERLVDHASLVVLERLISSAGGDPTSIHGQGDGWQTHPEQVAAWIDMTARGLAYAIVASLSVIDFETIIIDGSMPPDVREKIVEATSRQTDLLDLQGIKKPDITVGRIGELARAQGAACRVMSNLYSIDQNTLLRD